MSNSNNIKYIELENHIEGILPDGYVFLIDKDDYSLIRNNSWHILNKNSNDTYMRSTKLGLMHRLIMNAPDDLQIDHINMNKLDNRKSNLQIVTQQENLHKKSMYKTNKSGCQGVKWNKTLNKWQVQITRNKQRIHLGVFDNLQDAVIARRKAEI